MSEIIKTIAVKGKTEAVNVMNELTEKYKLATPDPENSLDASSKKLHAYYDSEKEMVIIESNDAGSIEEQLKELLLDFPTFF